MQMYVTGAVVSPEALTLNGKTRWVWVVDSFTEEPKFIGGEELCITPEPIADTEEGLLPGYNEEEEE